MAKSKNSASPVATLATSATRDATSNAEIETALDKTVSRLLPLYTGKKALPGWRILWPLGLEFIRINSAIIPTLTEERATMLVELAETDPHAFDAASYVAGMHFGIGHLTHEIACPLSLRIFGARVLAGEIIRPSQKGRRHADDALLRLWKYMLCQFVAERSPLSLGRNRSPSGPASFSACDAVAEAFARAGHYETPEQLESLCYDAGHAELRTLADTLGLLDFERAG